MRCSAPPRTFAPALWCPFVTSSSGAWGARSLCVPLISPLTLSSSLSPIAEYSTDSFDVGPHAGRAIARDLYSNRFLEAAIARASPSDPFPTTLRFRSAPPRASIDWQAGRSSLEVILPRDESVSFAADFLRRSSNELMRRRRQMRAALPTPVLGQERLMAVASTPAANANVVSVLTTRLNWSKTGLSDHAVRKF